MLTISSSAGTPFFLKSETQLVPPSFSHVFNQGYFTFIVAKAWMAVVKSASEILPGKSSSPMKNPVTVLASSNGVNFVCNDSHACFQSLLKPAHNNAREQNAPSARFFPTTPEACAQHNTEERAVRPCIMLEGWEGLGGGLAGNI